MHLCRWPTKIHSLLQINYHYPIPATEQVLVLFATPSMSHATIKVYLSAIHQAAVILDHFVWWCTAGLDIICDQICQKGSYTRTVSGLTFHYYLTDTTIDQQFMLVPLPNLQRSAFTEASFTGLSGVHGCSGGLLMARTCPVRQTDGRESLQDWLVRLGIDVATF